MGEISPKQEGNVGSHGSQIVPAIMSEVPRLFASNNFSLIKLGEFFCMLLFARHKLNETLTLPNNRCRTLNKKDAHSKKENEILVGG